MKDRARLQGCREALQQVGLELRSRGVGVEDKGSALLLDYRRAEPLEGVRLWLDALVAPFVERGAAERRVCASHERDVLRLTPP
ncbi:hypothetical protein BH11PSE8_BH11PSE8_34740 [soil metagenome]